MRHWASPSGVRKQMPRSAWGRRSLFFWIIVKRQNYRLTQFEHRRAHRQVFPRSDSRIPFLAGGADNQDFLRFFWHS